VATDTGSPCIGSGVIEGTVDVDHLTGSVDTAAGSWKFAAALADDESMLSGTWVFLGLGCDGRSGTFILTR
jgi:hypothetical protein